MSAKFGPAGNSDAFSAVHKSSLAAPQWIAEQGLDCYEYQCGKGVHVGEETCRRQRIPCVVAEPAGEAGRRAGKPAAKVIGVTEKLFAQRMRQLWEAECNRMEVED